ncbi:ATP-dependent Clp protease ATP-binding subunit [bacterium]|jgi:ATP-dependent Clp protease ATP-binding subunit ClpC|nr:ATP-dependent Clp protease ATP-binding subunit [bacterium]MBT4495968.1 ATP-dependent Clp protease ATP-binding subunit [bacterium]MBT4763514.1 ATP-dependent Clp protease ATP-binding subunit [bacterium]MBT5400885.1 ATP-dependent Clp protease ATP-binding subunit [bacterium]MBT5942206.1 ATP-dependent Clp protease ATP-binding subunit [bacterium]
MTDNIYNKFTKHFKHILTLSQDIAASLYHHQIEPLHLLYSLSNEKGSIGAEILHKNKLTPEKVRRVLEILNNNQSKDQTTTKAMPSLSKEASQIIEKSVKIAFEYNHKYVGTEHLILALVTSENTLLVNFFKELNISGKGVKSHIEGILKSTSKFVDLTKKPNNLNDGQLERVLTQDNNSKDSSALETFAVDLTDSQIQANIDPVIGREEEIDRVIQILSRRTKNNPILLGDPGTGKTAIVEGLAKRISENKVPDVLINKRILTLDLGSAIAGTIYRGEFENRLKQVIEEVKADPNIVLFIDEIHTVIGAGASTGSLDAANLFKPELARGNLRMIGATTQEEFKKHIESDPAFERRFQPVLVAESTPEETREILEGIKKNYEKYHQVKISNEAIVAAVELSTRYLPNKNLPDKAIDLIDEASAKIKVATTKNGIARTIKKLEKELSDIQEVKEKYIVSEKFDEALKYKSQEDDILKKLDDLKKEEDQEKKKILGTLTRRDIALVLSHMTKIPVSELVATEKQKLLNLEDILKNFIIGQDEALADLSKSIRRSRTGISDPNRPIASFIFLGPSGVGKTETAKILAREIYEDEDALIRIDMSEFSHSFNISKLIGAPAGYVGYKEQGKLTDQVKRKPYSVILFDEIEKAHPDVFDLLLPILEDGELTDATGKKINFKNTIIIMTSNIGLKEFNRQAELGFETSSSNREKRDKGFKKLTKTIDEGLSDTFRPEFLNRIDKVVIFKPLTEDDIAKITKLHLKDLAFRIKDQGINLKTSLSLEKLITKKSYDPDQGARKVRKIISDLLENPLATELLNDKFKDKKIINVKAQKEKVIFN